MLRPIALSLLAFLYSPSVMAVTVPVAAQANVQQVMQEVQNVIAGRFNTADTTPSVCKPQVGFSFTSISLNFTASATCKLQGKVELIFIAPMRVWVDLTVIGVPNVESMNFNADISFTSQSGSLRLNYRFLDGRIALRLAPNQPIINMALNGNYDMTFGGGKFAWVSRTNAIDTSNGSGFAFLSEFRRQPAFKSMQACMLSGGLANDVNAGTLMGCIAILK